MKKGFYLLFSLMAMCFALVLEPLYVSASDISLMYETTDAVATTLSISNNQANCTVYIMGDQNATKITGTIKLYDDTDKKTVSSWRVSEKKSYYSFNKKVTVSKGHTYTLSFTGYVYDSNGNAEYVYGDDSAKN